MLHQEQGDLIYETSYLRDVLSAVDGETEEELEERISREAQELGIDASFGIEAKAINTLASTHPRRSESIYSTASQSTGLTSNYSELSKEQSHLSATRRSVDRRSLLDYDSWLAKRRSNGRNSISFSPATTPSRSTFSLPTYSPEAVPKRQSRLIRGLSMLRLHRGDSSPSTIDDSPHRLHCATNERKTIHDGCPDRTSETHSSSFTTSAANVNSVGGTPDCCGTVVSVAQLEGTTAPNEQEMQRDPEQPRDDTAPHHSLARHDMCRLGVTIRPTSVSRKSSSESKVDSVAPASALDITRDLDTAESKELAMPQKAMSDRFIAWIETQRADLEERHRLLRSDLQVRAGKALDNLCENHSNATAEAEDRQVRAESNMRDQHAREKRDNATALKHMEAYCACRYSNGEAHDRIVTDQDRAELDKTKRLRDVMDSKHESAINVLRGEQSRRMKLRARRQESDVQELLGKQRNEELDLERQCTVESQRLDDVVVEKRRKLRIRWELQAAVLAKKIEKELFDTGPSLDLLADPSITGTGTETSQVHSVGEIGSTNTPLIVACGS